MKHRNLLPLLVFVPACYGYATTPAGSAEVTAAQVQPAGPVDVVAPDPGYDINTAPQVVYEGRPTYYYRDRWYYRGNEGRWHYYNREPNELRSRRSAGFQARPMENRDRDFDRDRDRNRNNEPRFNQDRDRDRDRDHR